MADVEGNNLKVHSSLDNGSFLAENDFGSFKRNASLFENALVVGISTVPPVLQNKSTSNGQISIAGDIRIPLYSIIFLLAVAGNILVIVTLALDKKMRTVTNVFLLNLAISDLLLAVFCMPFTLIPTIMRSFIFGKEMCVLLRYMQGVSVAVSVFTLVCISMERYFAICQPLHSRRWQTLSHSYHMIIGVWIISLSIMVPLAVYHRLITIRNERLKCIEIWPSPFSKQFYTIALDLLLLVIPLILMLVAYGLICMTLYSGIKMDMRSAQEMTGWQRGTDIDTDDEQTQCINGQSIKSTGTFRTSSMGTSGSAVRRYDSRYCHPMRQTNVERSLQAKKRAIRMLFVLVLEFFICWTPTYVMQTWYDFDAPSLENLVPPQAMNMIQLLAYVSSCTNPITYCFMNHKFRQGFINAFRCCPCLRKRHAAWSKREPTSGTSQRTVFTSVRSEQLTEVEKNSTYG